MVFGAMLHRERRLLPRYDFLLGMFHHCEPPHYSMLSSHSDQVLTGILPYDDGDYETIARRVEQGERPSRPRYQSQNQWLQYPVWDTITTGWNHKRDQRRGLSIVYQVFLTTSQRVLNVKVGEVCAQNDINLTMVGRSQTPKHGCNNVEKYSHGSLLSSSSREIRGQSFKDALMKWIK